MAQEVAEGGMWMSELEERGHCWFLPCCFAHPCGDAPPEEKGEGEGEREKEGESPGLFHQIPEGASVCSPEGQGKEGG